MAHRQQSEYITSVRSLLPAFFSGRRVIEIGSMDLNGTVREFFRDCDYTGLDVAAGPGVDIVCGGQDYKGADASFDVVLSCESMEHNPYWAETFSNMLRLCRPGGMVLVTCATAGRPEHGTSVNNPDSSVASLSVGWDYYKNLDAGHFSRAVDLDAAFSAYSFFYNYEHSDLYFLGMKRGAPVAESAEQMSHALRELRKQYLRVNVASLKPLFRMLLIRSLGDTQYTRVRRLYHASRRMSA
jgi:SAM-dependent methyltransferase